MLKKTAMTKARQVTMKRSLHAALVKAAPAGAIPMPPVMYALDSLGTPVQPKIKVYVFVTVLVVPDPKG